MKSIESVVDRDDTRSATIGPPLPSETAKAPWGPKAVGRIAFFFGPVAGALVVAISLRRMGHQRSAKKLLPLALVLLLYVVLRDPVFNLIRLLAGGKRSAKVRELQRMRPFCQTIPLRVTGSCNAAFLGLGTVILGCRR